jgi:RNase P/RNase MRP subunit p29
MKSSNEYTLIILAVASLLVLHCGIAFAQSQEDPDQEKVREAIQVTYTVLEQAQTVVMESTSQKARTMLERAFSIQETAGELADDNSASSLRRSLNLTLEARQLAYQAIALARQEMKTEESIARMTEETNDRIALVRDEIIDHDLRADHAMKLLDEARNMLEKSRLNAQQRRYQLALKLAENARNRVLQAEQYMKRIRALKGMVERRLALLEKLQERAVQRVDVQESEQIREQLQLIEQWMEQTKKLLREHRYQAAKMALENCEKAFRNLVRRFPSQNLTDPESMMGETYRLLERAEEMIGPDADAKRRGFLEEAKRLLTRAGDELANNRNEEALRLIQEARNTLRLAASEEKQAVTQEQARMEIQLAEALGEEIQPAIQGCDAPGVQMLLDRAHDRLDRARHFLDDGEYSNAEAEARISRNLYQRVREICGG